MPLSRSQGRCPSPAKPGCSQGTPIPSIQLLPERFLLRLSRIVPCLAPAGECSDKDCPFLHVDATTASPVGCPWYDRGFCRHGERGPGSGRDLGSGLQGKQSSHSPGVLACPCECPLCLAGPLCKYKHTRRVMCANYLVGFCPEGPKCKFVQ